MVLKQITIENYKSIKLLNIPIENFYERYLSFLGVNETGKTSILEAISLKSIHQKNPIVYSKSCYRLAQDEDEPISIKFHLELSDEELEQLNNEQVSEHEDDTTEPETEMSASVPEVATATNEPDETEEAEESTEEEEQENEPINSKEITYSYQIDVDFEVYEEFTYFDGKNEKVIPKELEEYLLALVPSVEFWRGRENELILDEITTEDIEDGENIPFNNCLLIAEMKGEHITRAKANGGRQSELGEKLTNEVTQYLNKRWPGHNIKIEFHVTDERVSCNVIDTANPGQQRIAPSARSDGFKKLVSFLLSLSVDYEKNEVSDSILLLDEPERFLHPEAQQNFRDELMAIASKNNNIVMIATHSMYMIDRERIDQCFGVEKKEEKKEFKTSIIQLSPDVMSFARINFAVFNIPTVEYHNELYGKLHMKLIEAEEEPEREVYTINGFDNDYFPKEKKMDWKRMCGKKEITEKVSIHSYIRHSIHHPENNLGNKDYTESQLRKSIEVLEGILYANEKKMSMR